MPPPTAHRRRSAEPPFDPLRLCIFATVALLGWLLGPVALLRSSPGWRSSATPRLAGQGLLRSQCLLGDTRLVLAYLVVLAGAAVAGIVVWVL